MAIGFCTRGLLLFLICKGLLSSTLSYSVSDAKNLHEHLFDPFRYNKLFRPIETVSVEARYNLLFLNSVDIKSQIMSTTGWFDVFWDDTRLAWKPSSYGNITYISVPEDLVWHPDLIVMNSIRESEKNFGAEKTIRITYFGLLRWEPIAVLSTSCLMIVAFFPFDSQFCTIDLASLDLPSDAVNLTYVSDPVNLDLHKTPGDWKVVKPGRVYSSPISVGSVLYSVLKFGMKIKRLPDHYFLIVIFPTILTAVLSFLTFFLPLKSGARIGYIITVVLALVVLFTLFADTMPSGAKYPSVLVALFTITLVMAFLLIIITIFVMRLYNKPKRDVAPKWMHSMVRKIRRLKLKLKLKCRTRVVYPLEKHQDEEVGRPTEDIDNVENSMPLKPYSNKQLAQFFDYFLFVAFTVLYILALLSVPIIAVVWYTIANKEIDN